MNLAPTTGRGSRATRVRKNEPRHRFHTVSQPGLRAGRRNRWCRPVECKPASVRIRAEQLHPLIPLKTLRWKEALLGPCLSGAEILVD
jgi:hypothetical protein